MSGIQITRAEAARLAPDVPRRGGWKSAQWCFPAADREVLVKDIRHSSPLYRWTVGRLLLWREAAMYERLNGLWFVPQFHGRLDADALMLERIPGQTLGLTPPEQLPPSFFDQLQECLNVLHARGIVHLDLRSRRNVLVTATGRPMLIDFANAVQLGSGWFARRVLLPRLAAVDNSGVLKFRRKAMPASLSAADWTRYRRFRRWRIFWPFDRLWQWLGLNRRLKRPAHPGPRRPV